jgi:aspartyl-tRNA(Asn)/glutamyl-tRNA(Gln) amidotransferase subunit B
MEIVSEPDMASPAEALAYLTALRQILVYTGVSDCNLEDGNMRSDVNISIRPEGQDRLGTKVEIKNINTFKGVVGALEFEIARQTALVGAGGTVVQETRRWDGETSETLPMRSKENAHDYRYFPEPDLLPVALSEEQIEEWRALLPELPETMRTRFQTQYGLPEYDAGVLCAQLPLAQFFEKAVAAGAPAKAASNWIMTDLLRLLGAAGQEVADLATVTPASFAALLKLVEAKTINMPTAKALFAEIFEKGGDPEALVKERGLAQVSDDSTMDGFVSAAIDANPKVVADFLGGKKAALQFLVGQVMKASRGKANPGLAAERIQKKLLG